MRTIITDSAYINIDQITFDTGNEHKHSQINKFCDEFNQYGEFYQHNELFYDIHTNLNAFLNACLIVINYIIRKLNQMINSSDNKPTSQKLAIVNKFMAPIPRYIRTTNLLFATDPSKLGRNGYSKLVMCLETKISITLDLIDILYNFFDTFYTYENYADFCSTTMHARKTTFHDMMRVINMSQQ